MATANLAEYTDKYTYRDYKKWDESHSKRYEIIYGDVYMMSSPTVWHQRTLFDLAYQLKSFLKDKPCEALIAPFDVRLFPKADESDNVIVQPDVMVICDKEKISDGKACRGAPTFVIEVESPGTKLMDRHVKKELFLKAGVKEYWIISTTKAFTYVLKDSAYIETEYPIVQDNTEIPVTALEGCVLKIEMYA
jgi:Uma2 family endonuclease